MIQKIRLCPDCGWDRRFEQHHTVAGSCLDSPDRDCPEWCCTRCGAAVLISVIPRWPDGAEVPVLADLMPQGLVA